MRFAFAAVIMAVLLAPAPLAAQSSQTLADIRQELTVLHVEIQRLKRELSTTGAPGGVTTGASVLERVSAIEAELQRLTAQTEQMQHRIDRVVSDGTNRIGDLEFRLCELEIDCDISKLPEASTLGGGTAVPQPPVTGNTGGTELAVGEEADFKAAEAALEAGDFQRARQDAQHRFADHGFPSAAFADQGTDLAGCDIQRDAAQHRAPGLEPDRQVLNGKKAHRSTGSKWSFSPSPNCEKLRTVRNKAISGNTRTHQA